LFESLYDEEVLLLGLGEYYLKHGIVERLLAANQLACDLPLFVHRANVDNDVSLWAYVVARHHHTHLHSRYHHLYLLVLVQAIAVYAAAFGIDPPCHRPLLRN
jgi:hypothetical protein